MENNFTLSDNIKKLPAYENAYKLSKIIWSEVVKWDSFNKWSSGMQLVRAADSVSANISEGYGRYFYKEKKLFYYYARGSLLEVVDFLRKATDRGLIEDNKIKEILILIKRIEKNINYIIWQIKQQ